MTFVIRLKGRTKLTFRVQFLKCAYIRLDLKQEKVIFTDHKRVKYDAKKPENEIHREKTINSTYCKEET